MPSLAMACMRRGAPVRLWSPAPQVEKKEPITITHGDGQANVPITKFPWTPSPNLKKMGKGCLPLRNTWNLSIVLRYTSHNIKGIISFYYRDVCFSGQRWTYLSLRTTPSMQAPNRNTLDMSEQLQIRKVEAFLKTFAGMAVPPIRPDRTS